MGGNYMSNKYLFTIYEDLYGEPFSYADFSNRLKMQKAIYLLQEMGVPVGDYRFSWYKHGPYSQALLDDMYRVDKPSNTSLKLSSDTKRAVLELKEALELPENTKYSQKDWAECLGSLHYLKEHIFSHSFNDENLLEELKKRKPHLSDNKSNKEALKRIYEIFS